MGLPAEDQVRPHPDDLKGPHTLKEIRVPIKSPLHIESLTQFDDHMRLLGYPKSLQRYEPTVRAFLNYGHKVMLVPQLQPGAEVDQSVADLEEAFAKESKATLEVKVHLLAKALIATLKFLRGE